MLGYAVPYMIASYSKYFSEIVEVIYIHAVYLYIKYIFIYNELFIWTTIYYLHFGHHQVLYLFYIQSILLLSCSVTECRSFVMNFLFSIHNLMYTKGD